MAGCRTPTTTCRIASITSSGWSWWMSWPLSLATKKSAFGTSVARFSFAARRTDSNASDENPSASFGSSNGRTWARIASGIGPSGVVAAVAHHDVIFAVSDGLEIAVARDGLYRVTAGPHVELHQSRSPLGPQQRFERLRIGVDEDEPEDVTGMGAGVVPDEGAAQRVACEDV